VVATAWFSQVSKEFMMKKKVILSVVTAVSVLAFVPALHADSPARPDGASGPSWTERWFGGGPGMMWGRGSGGDGYGWGPGGMMGGYGSRYGGGYGYGGMGAMMGMMGIGGHGMMGMGPYYMLDLNDQQRAKIGQIQDEMRKKNWEVMGKLLDEQARLRDLYVADKRDPAAIGKQSMKVAELRRQLLEASVDAHNRIEALLTKEQKERLRRFGPAWMMDED
jgi:Spy/CpxP family protein refolding chaperone